MFNCDNKINEKSLISLLFITVSTFFVYILYVILHVIMLNMATVDSYSIINH